MKKKYALYLKNAVLISLAAAILLFSTGCSVSRGNLFHIDKRKVEEIRLRTETTVDGHKLAVLVTSDREVISEIVDILNHFEYQSTEPMPNAGLGGSYSYQIILSDDFIHGLYSLNRIEVGPTWYIGEEGYFDRLMDLADTGEPLGS